MQELGEMRDRLGVLIGELSKPSNGHREWDDEEIYQWGLDNQGVEHPEITRHFKASHNSSIHNVLRRLSQNGRCVRVKSRKTKGVWKYYFGEQMPPERKRK